MYCVERPAWLFSSADRVWHLASAFSVCALLGVVAAISPTPIMSPWDVFTFLDGGWRIFNGQVPGIDFHNPVGPLVYGLTATGMAIAGPSLKAYAIGNLLFAAIITPWAAVVLFRKLPAPLALLMTIFITVLVTATHPLGYDSARTTYAMSYNRYGWALLSVLCVQLFLDDKTADAKTGVFDATSAGALLGLIFVCKISFFIFAAIAIALGCIMRRDLRQWCFLAPLAFAAVCALAWLAWGFSPLHYLSDVSVAGQSQSLALRVSWLKGVLKANAIKLAVLIALWGLLVVWPLLRRRMSLAFAFTSSIVFWFVSVAAIAIAAGNAPEGSQVPLFGVAGVILVELYRKHRVVADMRIYAGASMAVPLIFFANILAYDLRGYAHSHAAARVWDQYATAEQHFDAVPLRDFHIPHTSNWNTAYARAGDVPARINEGLALLRRHATAEDKLLSLAFADPFSAALGLRSPRRTPLWWDLGISFDRANHPRPEVLFSDVQLVIHPLLDIDAEGCCIETARVMLDVYSRFLSDEFAEIERTAHWALLKRRTKDAPG